MAGLEIRRLHLASLRVPDGAEWPVHGFVVMHPKGAILVDTGVGGPDRVLTDWRVVNRTAAEALGDHDLVPGDIAFVVNTHLHFDHCGQNAVFRHAPFYVQRTELERARREARWLTDWFDFAGARFELMDGDAEVLPGVRVIATPGHTSGHQSVVIDADGEELLIGDAAYTPAIYGNPDAATDELPPGQAADHPSWGASLRRIHSARPRHVHFCHHTRVVHG
ncbi:MAG TPA: N-acyl homoserine lactonase family protein [Candidatus Dormibacteraeota bacterium]